LGKYYDRNLQKLKPKTFKENWKTNDTPLRCIFPKGLFNSQFIAFFKDSLFAAGFKPAITEAKGNDLLNPVVAGEFDFVILPFLGIIPDADGYMEIFNPEGLLKSANIPSQPLIEEINKHRFIPDMNQRLEEYAKAFKAFEKQMYIIPIAQQNLPIIFRDRLRIPDVEFRFHVDLREVIWDKPSQ
jgi:ABC-type oligopeptide transport system substrate-binding subunit